MPKFMAQDDVVTTQIAGTGNYSFSGIRPEKLTAVEYTLATIVADLTGSTHGFSQQITESITAAVDACRHSPRADNLLIRVVTFNDVIGIEELHGFKPLKDIDPTAYQGIKSTGMTNLFDASHATIQATIQYAETLAALDFAVNAVVFIITDGYDNASRMTANEVKKALDNAVASEVLESINTILIGINASQHRQTLNGYASAIGLTQFVDAGDANKSNLAKVAQFVSKSISSQSQALGTGGPSQSLTF